MSGGASKRTPARDDLGDIPEVDFSRGIQPHRYARLRSGYRYIVRLEPDLWRHFGSPDAVEAALREVVARRRRAPVRRRAR
jgi:hypothetical protein